MATVLVGLLAGCSFATSRGAQTGVPSRLCAHTHDIVDLVVTRRLAFPGNHLMFNFPATTVVHDEPAARQVAAALCQLPLMPSGAVNCPADQGVTYALKFRLQQRGTDSLVIEPAGCQEVTGLGQARWLARSPGFWVTLATAMGIANPGNASFRGTQ